MTAPLLAAAMPVSGPVALTLESAIHPILTFNTDERINGAQWIVESVEGWDMPDVATAILPRPGKDGSWVGAGFYRARMLTLRGTIVGDTLALAQAAAADLLAACNLARTDGTLTVYEAIPTQVDVRLAGRVRLDRTLAGGIAVGFEIPLVAPDPRRYSTVEQSVTFGTVSTPGTVGGFELPLQTPFDFATVGAITGGTAVDVGGGVPVYPHLTFRGPCAQPTITNVTTGQSWRWTGTLVAGDTLEVDLDQATVLLGGTSSRYSLVDPASDWWALVPGRNILSYSAAGAGTGDVTVRWKNAWF